MGSTVDKWQGKFKSNPYDPGDVLGKTKGALGLGRFSATTRKVESEPFTRKIAGTGTQEELRKKQAAQSERLEAQATGAAPSIAEAKLKQASNRSLAQQLAAAQAQRGGSAAARERALAKSAGEARRDVAEQASIDKLKEQQLAEQSLASQLQAQRSQDITIEESQKAAEQALQQLLVQQNLAAQGINLSGFQSAAQQRSNFASGIMEGASSMMSAFSDVRMKKNIKSYSDIDMKKNKKPETSVKLDIPEPPKPPVVEKKEKKDGAGGLMKLLPLAMAAFSDKNCKKSIQKEDFNPKSFLDALQAYSYEYKNKNKPEAGNGRYLSVMAQDLEKAGPVGRSMVEETEDGDKIVNYGKGFGAILAAQAHLNQRLNELEKKKK